MSEITHFKAENAELKVENAKLREELAKAHDPQRIGGQADPSSFVYAIEQLREFRWQHATNDEDAIPYINNVAAAHERENTKLREELAKWERLAAGIDLPEYPVTQFKPKDLERENAELQDENARLRSCLSDDAENALMIVAENTKLRELCADLYAEMITYSDAPNYNASVWAPKLRELGIEV